MRYLVLVLLLLGAQFSLTAFAPAPDGKAWMLWPFSSASRPRLRFAGGLPTEPGSILVPLLAGVSGLSFLVAALGLFWQGVPEGWWVVLVLVASSGSALLHLLYLGRWAILPLAVDGVLLWGVLLQGWTVAGLRTLGPHV